MENCKHAKEKLKLLEEVQHQITWLEGASPITIDVRRDILLFKTLKFLLENQE